MAKKGNDNLAKMKCEVCKTTNYFTTRNKKLLKEKTKCLHPCVSRNVKYPIDDDDDDE